MAKKGPWSAFTGWRFRFFKLFMILTIKLKNSQKRNLKRLIKMVSVKFRIKGSYQKIFLNRSAKVVKLVEIFLIRLIL